jgi:hypothetical protein
MNSNDQLRTTGSFTNGKKSPGTHSHVLKVTNRKCKVKSTVMPALNYARKHEGMWRSKGSAHCILTSTIDYGDCLASHHDSFVPAKVVPLSIRLAGWWTTAVILISQRRNVLCLPGSETRFLSRPTPIITVPKTFDSWNEERQLHFQSSESPRFWATVNGVPHTKTVVYSWSTWRVEASRRKGKWGQGWHWLGWAVGVRGVGQRWWRSWAVIVWVCVYYRTEYVE